MHVDSKSSGKGTRTTILKVSGASHLLGAQSLLFFQTASLRSDNAQHIAAEMRAATGRAALLLLIEAVGLAFGIAEGSWARLIVMMLNRSDERSLAHLHPQSQQHATSRLCSICAARCSRKQFAAGALRGECSGMRQ